MIVMHPWKNSGNAFSDIKVKSLSHIPFISFHEMKSSHLYCYSPKIKIVYVTGKSFDVEVSYYVVIKKNIIMI